MARVILLINFLTLTGIFAVSNGNIEKLEKVMNERGDLTYTYFGPNDTEVEEKWPASTAFKFEDMPRTEENQDQVDDDQGRKSGVIF